MREVSPDSVVSVIVHNLNKNQNPTHWQLIEYLSPDCDCPEVSSIFIYEACVIFKWFPYHLKAKSIHTK